MNIISRYVKKNLVGPNPFTAVLYDLVEKETEDDVLIDARITNVNERVYNILVLYTLYYSDFQYMYNIRNEARYLDDPSVVGQRPQEGIFLFGFIII